MPSASVNHELNGDVEPRDLEGGIYLEELPEGVVLEVETNHHRYTIVNRTRGEALISGHPKYCPEPVAVRITGSLWDGLLLKAGFIGLGMRLAFQLPTQATITTSPIMQIRTREPEKI